MLHKITIVQQSTESYTGWNQLPCLEEHLAEIATSIIKINGERYCRSNRSMKILGSAPYSETVEGEERNGCHL